MAGGFSPLEQPRSALEQPIPFTRPQVPPRLGPLPPGLGLFHLKGVQLPALTLDFAQQSGIGGRARNEIPELLVDLVNLFFEGGI